MRVQDVIHAIQSACHMPKDLGRPTCDQLYAGDPQMEVRGIATTFMATVDVIRRAIDCGVNLIITHEPTFHSGWDETDWLEGSEEYREKLSLINDNNMAIWRFHDGMHLQPDLIYQGWIQEMGWEQYLQPGEHPHEYHIPETTVRELCGFFKEKLAMPCIRVVGDPNAKAHKVGVLVGGGSLGLGDELMPAKFMLERDLDVLVCGEIVEWTACSFVRDAAQLGKNRSMIILGHERTEEAGMKHLPQWMQPLVDVPVIFLDAGEPFLYL